MNVVISTVCSLEDLAISSEYGCDVYAKVLEKYHQKQHHKKILSSLCVVRTQDTLFDSMEFQ